MRPAIAMPGRPLRPITCFWRTAWQSGLQGSSSRKPVVDVDASQPIDGIGIALSINYQEPATDAERDIAPHGA